MSNEELYKETMDAIEELYADRSVSKEKAIENLKGLISEIENMIESLEE